MRYWIVKKGKYQENLNVSLNCNLIREWCASIREDRHRSKRYAEGETKNAGSGGSDICLINEQVLEWFRMLFCQTNSDGLWNINKWLSY